MNLGSVCLLGGLCAACVPGAVLFQDDFSRYPAGWLSRPVGLLNAAIQEYHYLPHRGVPLGPWENAICHLDAWIAGDEDGAPYLEQHLASSVPQFTNPIFLTGDPEWSDYTVEARVRPLSTSGMAGLVFRYHTNRHYYLFALSGGKSARLSLHLPIEKNFRVPEWRELAARDFDYDTTRYYSLRVENQGPRIRAYIDGRLILEANDGEILKGKAGISAASPARFQQFRVEGPEAAASAIKKRIAAREQELARLRAENPQPVLWKKFATPRFGAGRNVRFGDLNGDGRIDMLIAQNIPRVTGDSFVQISCLTAVDLDGKILWQSGRPDPANGLLTSDTPFQIHDIDGDGRNEVVLVRDFKLQVLDGATGKVWQWVWMPKTPAAKRPYDLENGDSIAFLNLSGDKRRREILVKDRYDHFRAFDSSLKPLWEGAGQTGHYPYPYDIDGQGRDTIAIGYSLWDHTGRQLWTHDRQLKDHADGIAAANLSGDPNAEVRVYASGSDEGFLMFDRNGTVLKHVRVGHAQSPVIGKFRSDVGGLQYMTINFWRNPGIVTLFDWDGNILEQQEPIHSGSVMLPVNWRGDGQEFVLLSGNAREGGMIDGKLRRVVMLPDDGHPDLTANVLDLTGDPRDEIVLWDQERVWIYTQGAPFAGRRIYAPERNPEYNESNYRINVSLPRWVDWNGAAGR
jgi:rhamnogalacturonan endolyase